MAANVVHMNAYKASMKDNMQKIRVVFDRKKTAYRAESEILFAKLRTSYAAGIDVTRQIDLMQNRSIRWDAYEQESDLELNEIQILIDRLHPDPAGPIYTPCEPSWMPKGSDHCIKEVTKTATTKLPSHARVSKEIADRACRCLGIDPVKHRQ